MGVKDAIPTRPTLLNRLKDPDDQASWKQFFDAYWGLIYRTARKAGLTDSEAQDVVQETLLSIFKQMPRFEYDPKHGSFKRWLLRLTSWRIADQLRRRMPIARPQPKEPGAERRTATIERVPDPRKLDLETVWNEEWEKNLVSRAMERIKHRVKPNQYQMFDLYYLQNWSVRRIAASLGVNPTWVYLTKHRLSRLLKREVRTLRTRME